MLSTKLNYRTDEKVNCERCKEDLIARNMFRYNNIIFCGWCIDKAIEELFSPYPDVIKWIEDLQNREPGAI